MLYRYLNFISDMRWEIRQSAHLSVPDVTLPPSRPSPTVSAARISIGFIWDWLISRPRKQRRSTSRLVCVSHRNIKAQIKKIYTYISGIRQQGRKEARKEEAGGTWWGCLSPGELRQSDGTVCELQKTEGSSTSRCCVAFQSCQCLTH